MASTNTNGSGSSIIHHLIQPVDQQNQSNKYYNSNVFAHHKIITPQQHFQVNQNNNTSNPIVLQHEVNRRAVFNYGNYQPGKLPVNSHQQQEMKSNISQKSLPVPPPKTSSTTSSTNHQVKSTSSNNNNSNGNNRQCENPKCRTTETPLWRKGYYNEYGRRVTLCNACGLHWRKGHFCKFCNEIYRDVYELESPEPWIYCVKCQTWVHKKCAIKKGLVSPNASTFIKQYTCDECTQELGNMNNSNKLDNNNGMNGNNNNNKNAVFDNHSVISKGSSGTNTAVSFKPTIINKNLTANNHHTVINNGIKLRNDDDRMIIDEDDDNEVHESCVKPSSLLFNSNNNNNNGSSTRYITAFPVRSNNNSNNNQMISSPSLSNRSNATTTTTATNLSSSTATTTFNNYPNSNNNHIATNANFIRPLSVQNQPTQPIYKIPNRPFTLQGTSHSLIKRHNESFYNNHQTTTTSTSPPGDLRLKPIEEFNDNMEISKNTKLPSFNQLFKKF